MKMVLEPFPKQWSKRTSSCQWCLSQKMLNFTNTTVTTRWHYYEYPIAETFSAAILVQMVMTKWLTDIALIKYFFTYIVRSELVKSTYKVRSPERYDSAHIQTYIPSATHTIKSNCTNRNVIKKTNSASVLTKKKSFSFGLFGKILQSRKYYTYITPPKCLSNSPQSTLTTLSPVNYKSMSHSQHYFHFYNRHIVGDVIVQRARER